MKLWVRYLALMLSCTYCLAKHFAGTTVSPRWRPFWLEKRKYCLLMCFVYQLFLDIDCDSGFTDHFMASSTSLYTLDSILETSTQVRTTFVGILAFKLAPNEFQHSLWCNIHIHRYWFKSGTTMVPTP